MCLELGRIVRQSCCFIESKASDREVARDCKHSCLSLGRDSMSVGSLYGGGCLVYVLCNVVV